MARAPNAAFPGVPSASGCKEVDGSIIWASIVANKEANLIGDIISFQYTRKQSCDILSGLRAIDLRQANWKSPCTANLIDEVGHHREDAYTTTRTPAVKAYINPANCVPHKLSNSFASANVAGLNPGATTLMRVRADTICGRIQELNKALQVGASALPPSDSFHNNKLSK